jgi:hypothetical protein
MRRCDQVVAYRIERFEDVVAPVELVYHLIRRRPVRLPSAPPGASPTRRSYGPG